VRRRAHEATGRLTKDELIESIPAELDCLGADAGYGVSYTAPNVSRAPGNERSHAERRRANGGNRVGLAYDLDLGDGSSPEQEQQELAR
jgi:hypothetical protein